MTHRLRWLLIAAAAAALAAMAAEPRMQKCIVMAERRTRPETSPEETNRRPNRQALVTALLGAAQDPSGDVSQNVCHALSALGSEATPSLIETLSHADKDLRGKAAYILGHMGSQGRASQAEPAMPALTKLLKDDDVEVRKLASWAILQIVSNGKEKAAE
jgi:HEAT repeat protein